MLYLFIWPLLFSSVASISILDSSQQYNIESASDQHWSLFKKQYNKQYLPHHENLRRSIWESNVKLIHQHNKEYAQGLHSYTLASNKFSDLTFDEFKKNYFGCNHRKNQTFTSTHYHKQLKQTLPDEVDWEKEGYVTQVKDQGQCGSCWTFPVTGTIEGQYFKKFKKLIAFSEQQLIDCAIGSGSDGCCGGEQKTGFEYVRDNGISTEADYPYQAANQACNKNIKPITKITGYVKIPFDEAALQDAVANVGPISVSIFVNEKLQLYKDGVFNPDPKECSSPPDHAVLVVGYGEEENIPYWNVKNSWGAEWGNKGYIKMARNKNLCQIASDGSYPLI